jgi:hypothetical protein
MIRAFSFEAQIDGFVYLSGNVVAARAGNDRDLSFWIPAYRKEGNGLPTFVNRLGTEWGLFYERRIGKSSTFSNQGHSRPCADAPQEDSKAQIAPRNERLQRRSKRISYCSISAVRCPAERER